MPDSNVVRGNVLIVEDDADTGHMLSALLAEAGYGVRLAKNRDMAAEALSQYLYEYIILDLMMSGMTVEKFTASLARSGSSRASIIVLSAAEDAEEQTRKIGAKHWMSKPFDPAELVATLRACPPPTNDVPLASAA